MNKASRRDMFKLAGGAAGAIVTGHTTEQAVAEATKAQPRREALESLTAAEAAILEAFCARLIPSDSLGPGAAEARAAHYIDRSLAGALASSRETYRSGLMALDAYALTAKGASFVTLSPDAQDAVLSDVEKNVATGFTPNGATFFMLVRTHTIQGTFSDPYYGGNADFIGWDMIGYPGIRLAVSEQEQAMTAHLTPVRKSAYDFPMFDRRSGNIASHNPAPVDHDHMPSGMGDLQHGN